MATDKWIWINFWIDYLEKLMKEDGLYVALAYSEIKDDYFNEFGADLTADLQEYYKIQQEKEK